MSDTEGLLGGEHALVTGGSRGIGAAIAESLSVRGARVTIVGRNRAAADEAASRLPGPAEAVAADVSQADEVQAAFSQAEALQGAVTVLVNNVGGAATAPFLKTSEETWSHMFNVNLRSVRLCTEAVLPTMLERKRGRIVNVASTAGLRGYAYVSAYVAAKHAVVGLTRALAAETQAAGIFFGAVCPGFVDTEMTRNAAATVAQRTGQAPEAILASYAASNAHGRLVRPEEVAASVTQLCDPRCPTATGAIITIDGSGAEGGPTK